ncbi:ATP-binding protein [Streptomyces sp. NBC_01006]|uniref:ATP-binding protein n=1 Tax=Streptomyces sp. NBC_01006 TaxID=2903716 RepID=UPI002F9184C4|nr:ATP-binding protein [Streptomyces sp. NBC_01006]
MPAHRVDITLPATPEAARSARRALSEAAIGSDLADDARLLVTEAVGNAVRHTVSTRIRMVVAVEPGTERLLCALRDDTPHLGPANPAAAGCARRESGRGLGLIAALSQSWGVATDGAGKWVWFWLAASAGRA